MTLNQTLLPLSPYREHFVEIVKYYCETATVISVLASLLFLFETNRAFDVDDHELFNGCGYKLVEKCFRWVLDENHRTLPLAFKQTIERAVPNFQWPKRHGMGNAFNTLFKQYKVNVKNNIRTWSYSRIRKFFKLKQFELNLFDDNITDIDVKNATKAVMFNNITPSENVELLLVHARMIGIPVGQNFANIVRSSWFKTIPIFIHIQRQIFEHHERYERLNEEWRQYHRDPANNQEPRIARPPKIVNFRVIPLHDFKMKHIRIDRHLFFDIASKVGALKLAKGYKGQPINIDKTVYDENPVEYWGLIFNIDKINQMAKDMTFDNAIVTDSLDVSLCYDKPQISCPLEFDEQLEDFEFVLGMDPGVRTWNATVRKHIESGVQVLFQITNYNYSSLLMTDFDFI